jgi:hypothetical protein
MALPEDDTTVLGSQRARQGQNVKGMRKVLIWGTALTAAGFAILLALFGGQSAERNAQQPPPPVASQPSPANPS